MDKETREEFILLLSLATINLTGEGDEGVLALVEKCISALKSDAQTIARQAERIAELQAKYDLLLKATIKMKADARKSLGENNE